MSKLLDNILTYRIIAAIATPFKETDAFKLGIIDENGNNLIPSKNFTRSEQKEAYTFLDRLVFNVKKIINKLPGGESKTKNLVSAYFLVKESYESEADLITEETLLEMHDKLADRNYIEENLIAEEVAANNVGGGNIAGTQEPTIRLSDMKKYKTKLIKRRKKPLVP